MTPELPTPSITWLGHSTVVLDIGGARLITDPLLRKHNWPLRRRGGRPATASWSQPDLVLLSHLHHDHAELPSLRLLRDVPVLTAAENAVWLRRKGLNGLDAEGKWYDLPGTDVRVRLVRADHGHRPMPHRPNSAGGHLVQKPGFTVYVAGDTSLYGEMSDLPQLAEAPIDVAIVPIGGWGPRLSVGTWTPNKRPARVPDRREGGHSGALGDASRAGGGSVPPRWMDLGGPLFQQALSRHAPDCRAWVLAPGETVSVP